MDTHIVNRLRTRVYTHPYDPANAVMLDAADEIERLQIMVRNATNLILNLRESAREVNLELDKLTEQLNLTNQEKE